MNRTGEQLPRGFQGPVTAWSSLVPSTERALRLPADRGAWRADPAGDTTYDLVEVAAVTESLGRIEDALADLSGRLEPGGTMLLDFDNQQSARALRLVVEGRSNSFEPLGSSDDPSQVLSLKRVLAGAVAVGLTVVDVLAGRPTPCLIHPPSRGATP